VPVTGKHQNFGAQTLAAQENLLHSKGTTMMNQFSAARERKSLDMAVVKFIAGGGKITKVAPIYGAKKEPDLSSIPDVQLRKVPRKKNPPVNHH